VLLVEDVAAPLDRDAGVQRETREQIALAFRELSPKLRVVATLALVEDVPHREIAEALGISEAAVRVRAFRAARILREQLKELMPDYERAK
jgi:RNA polymerase sigma-70 factor (ECF subfamily)